MEKQFLSLKQFFGTTILFIFGSSVVMGVNTDAGPDSWISFLIAGVLAFPLLLLYARLVKLYPEKNIFEMMLIVFGKVAGRIIIVLFMFYCLHLGALVMVNFSKFIKIAVMPETPEIMIMTIMIIPVIYIAKSELKTLGKWSSVSAMIVFCVLIFTVAASFNVFEFHNLMPFLNTEQEVLLSSSIKILAWPFGEIVMLLVIADVLSKKTSSYKAFIWGCVLSAIFLLTVVFRNTLTLGSMMQKIYFPSFTQAKIIRLSESFARIEGLISFNFMLAGITKATVCLIALAKGFTVLLKSDNHQKFIFPSSFLIVAAGLTMYPDIMKMFLFMDIYHYYAAVFQMVIPATMLIVSEIKRAKNPEKFILAAAGSRAEYPENEECNEESNSVDSEKTEYIQRNENDDKNTILSGD